MFSSDFRCTPLWQDNYSAAAAPDAQFPSRADAVIVGSGYTGCSAALTLARKGASVVVLETNELGHGASTRNFGYAMGPENRGRYSGRYADHEVDRIVTAYSAASTYLRALIDEFGPEEVGLRREGQLVVAHSAKAFAALSQAGPLASGQSLIKPSHLPEVIGSEVFHGGLLSREAAAVHPGKMHAELVRHAQAAGALFFDHCPATTILRTGTGYSVQTPKSDISADFVALATNGHSGKLNPFVRRRVLPIVGTVIATQKLETDLAYSLMPKGHWCADTQFGFRCFRLSPDNNRLVFAKAGLPGSFEGDVRPYARAVYRHMVETFPQLKDVSLDYAWPASVGVTFDALPHLGQNDGIWFAGGFNGHGVAMSHYLGHLMGRRILGDQSDRTFMEDTPFPTSLFYHGNTWFMPLIRQLIKLKGLQS